MAAPVDPVPPPSRDDWPAQATDNVVRLVDTVRSKTTGPAITAGRAVVYGLFAAVLGVAALVLVSVVAIRVVNLLPGDVWVAHLIVGALFTLAGLFLWRKGWARPRTA